MTVERGPSRVPSHCRRPTDNYAGAGTLPRTFQDDIHHEHRTRLTTITTCRIAAGVA